MRAVSLLAFGATVGIACAEVYLGFNSGATNDQKKAKQQADFEKEFETAQKLKNSPGLFNSVRLYTNIQADTPDTPIEAFPAAIKTSTKLLLGIWCSGTTTIEKELSALSKAIDQYGSNFTNLVVGISVGSEDLYRVSESGVRNKAGLGQDADTVIAFVKDVRDAIENTALSNAPIGHVDTWSAWANTSNSDVLDEVDFIGTNLFPYYEDDKGNDISNATNVFEYALNSTKKAAGNKPVWITETGWPSSGPDFGQAKATMDNAKTYWDTIGCSLFGRENVFWYVLQDSNPDNEAKFALTKDLSTTAQFNLTCPAGSGAPASINTSAGATSRLPEVAVAPSRHASSIGATPTSLGDTVSLSSSSPSPSTRPEAAAPG
ncbi:glucan 1,3-beta-glucosidase [Lophiotrema nucula]|uniref:Glucan 1,3-beta-glucosidase n=1 Tax=Lophiotrema nucula TaxID=690887 RepID=A0A6A5ZP98_9PLEO|nr:glucan 1,3-beta-glucosidase [Lophiotrema nucula]